MEETRERRARTHTHTHVLTHTRAHAGHKFVWKEHGSSAHSGQVHHETIIDHRESDYRYHGHEEM